MSTRDFVPLGEMVNSFLKIQTTSGILHGLDVAKRVVRCTPPPEASLFDHGILNPTFKVALKETISELTK